MRTEDAVYLLIGQLLGRGIQEASEFLPLDPNLRKAVRFAVGVGGLVAVTKVRMSPETEALVGVASSKVLADELVDFILQFFSKPASAQSSQSLAVPVQIVPVQRKASLY